MKRPQETPKAVGFGCSSLNRIRWYDACENPSQSFTEIGWRVTRCCRSHLWYFKWSLIWDIPNDPVRIQAKCSQRGKPEKNRHCISNNQNTSQCWKTEMIRFPEWRLGLLGRLRVPHWHQHLHSVAVRIEDPTSRIRTCNSLTRPLKDLAKAPALSETELLQTGVCKTVCKSSALYEPKPLQPCKHHIFNR
jgi:hypothetical protein